MTTAADPSEEIAASLSGEHIAKMLRAAGPIVKCVLLRARSSTSVNANAEDATNAEDGADAKDDSKASPTKGADESAESKEEESTKVEGDQADSDEKNDNDSSSSASTTSRTVLTHLIEEIEIDTTPKKQMVVQTLGGPFTFLGQYEEEGTMVIVRRPEAVSDDDDNDAENKNETDDDNFMNHINPHQLQPPLHEFEVYGDILLLRVAPTEEEGEEEEEEAKDQETTDEKASADDEVVKPEADNEPSEATSASASISAPTTRSTATSTADTESSIATARILTNEEFFLDYTKEEYIKFASRTDIIPKEEDNAAAEEGEEAEGSGSEEDSDEGSGSEDEDGEYVVFDGSDEDDMEEDEEECQIGMMNLILAQILKRFREENGRGPNTEELLAMRSALAEKLGLDESIINGLGSPQETNEDGTAAAAQNSERKRKSDGDSPNGAKRVKFTGKDEVKIMTDDEAASTTGEEKM